MNTGNSKTAFSAARVSLLTGVSATAFAISMGAAQAQTVKADGLTGTGVIINNNSGQLFGTGGGIQPVQGFTFNNATGTTFVNGGGGQFQGTGANGNNQLAGFGGALTPLSGTGGGVGLATVDLINHNGVTINPNEGVQVGNTVTGPAVSINPNGNISATGNYTTTNGNITSTNGTVSGKTVSAGPGGLASTGGLNVTNNATTPTSSITGTGTATVLTINGSGFTAGPSLRVVGGEDVSGGFAAANNTGAKPFYIVQRAM